MCIRLEMVIMGVCTSLKLTREQSTIVTVMTVRTKVPRLEPISHSSLAKSRVGRRLSDTSEVVSALSSPLDEPST